MAKHGKSYNAAAEKIDRATLYTPLQAAKLLKELDTAKFDETVEAHFRLGIDTRKADQNIRGSISLPHGTGKTVRVAVFAEGEKAREAEAAGADIIGSDELVRADRYGICHVPLGKKSFSEQQLVENYAALYTEILRVKPSSAKGKYVKSISVASTMGPGVKVDPAVQRDFLAE